MVEVKKFNPSHLSMFNCREDFENLNLTMLEAAMSPDKDVTTLFDKDGKVICFAGITHRRIGVGEVWIIGSDLINKNKIQFIKRIKGLLLFLEEHMDLYRIEMAVNCQWEQGHKWATCLGFSFESIAKRYDHFGNDHAIYVRFK